MNNEETKVTKTEELGLEPDVYHWFIFAGTEPAVLVKQEVNDMVTLKSTCRLLAKHHKAAIWAVAVLQVTGIMAWPCPPISTLD